MPKRVAWRHQYLYSIRPRSHKRVLLTDVPIERWEQTQLCCPPFPLEKAQKEAQHDGFCVHTHNNTHWQRTPPSVTLNHSFGGLAHLTSVVRQNNAKSHFPIRS